MISLYCTSSAGQILVRSVLHMPGSSACAGNSPKKCGKHLVAGHFSVDDCVFLHGHKKNLMVGLNVNFYMFAIIGYILLTNRNSRTFLFVNSRLIPDK